MEHQEKKKTGQYDIDEGPDRHDPECAVFGELQKTINA
jgi:hypothetical protein